jgi:small-conductance mechanosensitive channel
MDYIDNIIKPIRDIKIDKNIINKIIISIFIFIIFLVIGDIVFKLIVGNNYINNINIKIAAENNYSQNNILLDQIGNLVYYTIIIVGIIYALLSIGLQITTIMAIFGVLSLAISFAVTQTIQNIFAVIYITSNNVFQIGDRISIESSRGLFNGKVIQFNLFNTILFNEKTESLIIIPNSKIQDSIILNYE